MNLMICATLFPHIVPYRLFIPVLTDGIRVESTRPETFLPTVLFLALEARPQDRTHPSPVNRPT